MMALPIALGLVSCKDDDNNSVLGNDGVEETLNLTEPAEDQMSVTVTANLSTAVPVTFEESPRETTAESDSRHRARHEDGTAAR